MVRDGSKDKVSDKIYIEVTILGLFEGLDVGSEWENNGVFIEMLVWGSWGGLKGSLVWF